MDRLTKRVIIDMLSTKSIDNPNGVYAPNLTALMCNTRYALEEDVKPVFLKNLRESLEEAETICSRVRCVLSLLEDSEKDT